MQAKVANKSWWGYIRRQTCDLLLDSVRAAEHAVNAGKVIDTGNDGVRVSLGCVVLLQVSLLTHIAHLPIHISYAI
jgi:hypothetical protein